jgi:hypothetical protein
MSWYETRKKAEEACKWKEKEYGEPFIVLEEINPRIPGWAGSIWWAQRKSALDENKREG